MKIAVIQLTGRSLSITVKYNYLVNIRNRNVDTRALPPPSYSYILTTMLVTGFLVNKNLDLVANGTRILLPPTAFHLYFSRT